MYSLSLLIDMPGKRRRVDPQKVFEAEMESAKASADLLRVVANRLTLKYYIDLARAKMEQYVDVVSVIKEMEKGEINTLEDHIMLEELRVVSLELLREWMRLQGNVTDRNRKPASSRESVSSHCSCSTDGPVLQSE
jgi:hypothetical protein